MHGFFLRPWGRKSIAVIGKLSLSCVFNTEFMEQYSSAGCATPFPLLSEAVHLKHIWFVFVVISQKASVSFLSPARGKAKNSHPGTRSAFSCSQLLQAAKASFSPSAQHQKFWILVFLVKPNVSDTDSFSGNPSLWCCTVLVVFSPYSYQGYDNSKVVSAAKVLYGSQ